MKVIDSLKPRQQVADNLKWDLSDIFSSEEEFRQAIENNKAEAVKFSEKYYNQLNSADKIISALNIYEENKAISDWIQQYATLMAETDMTNSENLERSRFVSTTLAKIAARLSFFKSQVLDNAESVLQEVAKKEPKYAPYIRKLLLQKGGQLTLDVEKTLADFKTIFDQPLENFEQIRSNDLEFGTFMAHDEEYPLSFVLYEEYYMYHPDTEIRRNAYKKFSEVLSCHQNGMASIYYTEVERQKIESDLRGYDSIFDFLLIDQEVDRELYDRQIDIIMEEFAPVMRKYITHVKEENNLDEIFYADLKMDLDPSVDSTISIPESEMLIEQTLEPLGETYLETIMRSYPERWIDFPRNIGKRTGASSSTAYGKHPYVILSWSDRIETVYTLIHELGHSGQSIYSNKYQPISAARPSLYLIEAPSTFNELLLTDHLFNQAKDVRDERDILSTMISKTYFHNFVTHLLEAAYQREVYQLIDEGKSFSAETLNHIKRHVLEEFWGDTVTLEKGAELTWMRQRHYYRGLYPYTYSAGLTIATQAFLNYRDEGQPMIDKWLEFISLGGSLTPVDAAKVAGVDITSEEPLRGTIAFLETTVNRIIELSEQLKTENR